MGEVLNVTANAKPVYNIYFENDYSKLAEVFKSLEIQDRKLCIVSDTNVSEFLMEPVKEALKEVSSQIFSYVFEAGEESKNITVVQGLYEYLIQNKFDRKDVLVALGGGVVGDLTGFTAATYLRGIRFVQMPTSLLAMVDSSVGGKTGIDFLQYKNMVGAFHQPKAVYINLSALQHLTEEHYFNGYGEVVKYGMIQDAEFFKWLEENEAGIKEHDLADMMKVVYKSCNYKRDIVQRDPNEKGERALLNFGHTLGHAIEKSSHFQILHGQCVSLGMVTAAYISMKRGYIGKEDLQRLEKCLASLNLPIRMEKINIPEVIAGTKNDKKMEAGKIKFILLRAIGDAYIDTTVTDQEMEEALGYLMK